MDDKKKRIVKIVIAVVVTIGVIALVGHFTDGFTNFPSIGLSELESTSSLISLL